MIFFNCKLKKDRGYGVWIFDKLLVLVILSVILDWKILLGEKWKFREFFVE